MRRGHAVLLLLQRLLLLLRRLESAKAGGLWHQAVATAGRQAASGCIQR